TSVDRTERPPGGGVPPAVLGALQSSDYVLDQAAGTITRAPGLDPVWARIVWQWEDGAEQQRLASLERGSRARSRREAERRALGQLPRIALSHADPDVRELARLMLAWLREDPPDPSDVHPEEA